MQQGQRVPAVGLQFSSPAQNGTATNAQQPAMRMAGVLGGSPSQRAGPRTAAGNPSTSTSSKSRAPRAAAGAARVAAIPKDEGGPPPAAQQDMVAGGQNLLGRRGSTGSGVQKAGSSSATLQAPGDNSGPRSEHSDYNSEV